MSLDTIIDAPAWSGLTDLAARLGGAAARPLSALLAPPGRGRSTLNNDGSPLQFCIGLGPAGAAPTLRRLLTTFLTGLDDV